MSRHHFYMKANWSGGRGGVGTISAGHLQSHISIPEVMDGPGVGTNPDEMLIGAAGTCYLITLAAILERRQLPVLELTLETEGIVHADKKLVFEKIIHRPRLVVEDTATENQLDSIKQAAEHAEKNCMISNALRGNVELEVDAHIFKKHEQT
ncbi:SACOL1771 family peroxiredoxin [Paenactinomyces guangxiensis]|uniref:SACOL1771 family peroxiredoxin n=1 Tax=Paenactinomyces guangxiensis TaxID=1490290 RepID=A0A7W2A7R7_9BACL|nr:SACOL1771 family peroxiredoxin [Paenactinomyces guangxiensis]MBA4493068.1 SACOL1771 family peroxiredoxin [Paenactinomyces guangxiensis]MBH8590082.1 SACOL1771 family peroxiredoxin [Paenactinomyces guangxiensis]